MTTIRRALWPSDARPSGAPSYRNSEFALQVRSSALVLRRDDIDQVTAGPVHRINCRGLVIVTASLSCREEITSDYKSLHFSKRRGSVASSTVPKRS